MPTTKEKLMAKNEERIIIGLILSCWLIYTFSMCMKMAYSGSMASIKEEYNMPHIIASLPITLYYAFYAGVQFVLAAIMRRINLKIYMAVTFILSALSFVSVFFYSPIWYIGVVLALNGITLGAVWCGSLAVFGKYLSFKTMNRALLFMGIGFSAGSAMSYGVSAIAVYFGNWRISFIVFGLAFLLSTFYFLFVLTRAENAGIKPQDEEPLSRKQVYRVEKADVKPLLILSTIVVFFACLLYYGFTNWMPTIMSNVFDVSNSTANLISMLLPLVSYIGPVIAVLCCNKLKNDFLVTVIFSLVSTVIGLALAFVFEINVIVTTAIILVLIVSLRLLSSMTGSLVPLHIRDYVNSGKSAALINAVACIAAAGSPTIISLILDASGGDWGISFLILFVFSAIMLAISVVFMVVRAVLRRKANLTNDAV